MKYSLTLALLLSSLVLADDAPETPRFLEVLIESFRDQSPEIAPEEVWSYWFRDRRVFYVAPQYCCDLSSTLYDESGEVICHPDGGIAGSGDGRCPDFFKELTDGVRIWRHPDLGEE